jgi:hypothetical protein
VAPIDERDLAETSDEGGDAAEPVDLPAPIVDEANGLEAAYEGFRQACLQPGSGAEAAAAGAVAASEPPERSWYALWRSVGTQPLSPECERQRDDLGGRADRIAASLEAFETRARQRGLDPESSRQVLAAARLARWREAREEGARPGPP